MLIKISKDIYSKGVLLKTAYSFTDEYYVKLDQKNNFYVISIDSKNGVLNSNIEKEFCNELILQATRESILEKTSTIRELVLARAFASTIVDTSNDVITDEKESVDGTHVFEDWYKE